MCYLRLGFVTLQQRKVAEWKVDKSSGGIIRNFRQIINKASSKLNSIYNSFALVVSSE